jgi:hypothetical protein
MMYGLLHMHSYEVSTKGNDSWGGNASYLPKYIMKKKKERRRKEND